MNKSRVARTADLVERAETLWAIEADTLTRLRRERNKLARMSEHDDAGIAQRADELLLDVEDAMQACFVRRDDLRELLAQATAEHEVARLEALFAL